MFNVGFKPVNFKQNTNQPLAGKIVTPPTKKPEVPTPTPLAGLITPPTVPPKAPAYPTPPLAGIIAPPSVPSKTPTKKPQPLAGIIAPPQKEVPTKVEVKPENIDKK